MTYTISFPRDLYTDMVRRLRSTSTEQVSFLFANEEPDEVLRVTEVFDVPSDGFEHQSAYHITLSDEIRGVVIAKAWRSGSCLIEVHSHVSHKPASFSPTDISGLEEWVPHIQWRLRRRTYAALVFGGTSFDALVWERGNDAPSPLQAIAVDGVDAENPTGITHRALA